MLVIHENRGLTDRIRSVASRLAGEGTQVWRLTCCQKRAAPPRWAIRPTPPPPCHGHRNSGCSPTCGQDSTSWPAGLPQAKLAAIGFCFGGGLTWSLLAAGDPAWPLPSPSAARRRPTQIWPRTRTASSRLLSTSALLSFASRPCRCLLRPCTWGDAYRAA
ncbi:MAG: hypothetical protein ACRDZ4_22550 [Egibacteraceae bacterium]